MKKTVLITFLINAVAAFAQEYNFDRLIQYEENGDNIIQIYFNSGNEDYYLHLRDGKNGQEAEIFDRSTDRIHEFDVFPVQEHNGLIYEYKYVDSKKLPAAGGTTDIAYEFNTKRDDKYYRFTDLTLNHSGKSEPFLSADLALRYSEENLFNAFNLCCLLGFDQWDRIETREDFVVVRAQVYDADGSKYNYRLIDDQVVQFKLKANDKKNSLKN